MTFEDRATFRSVVLPAEDAPAAYRAGDLLDEMGHDVAPATSPADALDLLEQNQTDLLIVDVSGSPPNHEFVEQLADLPMGIRPRQIAVFSDSDDDSFRGVRSRIKPSKLHIFLKPLHMHGLLTVLRRLESQQPV
jgi:two-component SAPR family response regulator